MKSLTIQYGKKVLPLRLHVVFIVKGEHFKNFKYQLLAADSTKGVDSEMQRVWDAVQQYKSRIGRGFSSQAGRHAEQEAPGLTVGHQA